MAVCWWRRRACSVSRSWRSVFAHIWSSASEAGRNHSATPAHGPASSCTHRHSSRTATAIADCSGTARPSAADDVRCHVKCDVKSEQKRTFHAWSHSERLASGPASKAPRSTAAPAASSQFIVRRDSGVGGSTTASKREVRVSENLRMVARRVESVEGAVTAAASASLLRRVELPLAAEVTTLADSKN